MMMTTTTRKRGMRDGEAVDVATALHGTELIQTAYRRECGSVKDCLRSLAYLHNETVNIYSHTVGAALFYALPVYLATTPRYTLASMADKVVIGTYLVSTATCFLLSTAFHTLTPHRDLQHLSTTADLAGIHLLMWSATLPLTHFAYADCAPPLSSSAAAAAAAAPYYAGRLLRPAHDALATALAVASAHAAARRRDLHGPRAVARRAALFAAFAAASFALPLATATAVHYYRGRRAGALALAGPAARALLATAACNGAGVLAYAFRFPERWFPRRFDLFGASHQIMHVMVLLAAVAYTVAVLRAFDAQHQHGGLVC